MPTREREVVSTRTVDAPRERVFTLFSDPEFLAQWWGPKGFTNAFHVFEFKKGGAWRFTMRGPDGALYRIDKKFVEIVPPERIVLDNLDPAHGFRMTMTFAEDGGTTLLTWRMRFESSEEFERVRERVAAANEQNFDRLEALLKRLNP